MSEDDVHLYTFNTSDYAARIYLHSLWCITHPPNKYPLTLLNDINVLNTSSKLLDTPDKYIDDRNNTIVKAFKYVDDYD